MDTRRTPPDSPSRVRFPVRNPTPLPALRNPRKFPKLKYPKTSTKKSREEPSLRVQRKRYSIP
eukprot:1368866-Amorphochlora_amoeboformis.AAC.1